MSRSFLLGLVSSFLLAPVGLAQEIPADTEIVQHASGMKYSVLEAGEGGASPAFTDEVTVHYTGWFPDGRVFDSSRQRGTPATFKVGGVVEGWNIALQEMTPGSRWKLTIPSDLAYGDEGRSGIPGGSTLIFDVQLISFVKGPGMPAFRRVDAEKAVELPSGARMEIAVPGAGKAPPADMPSIFHYTVYSMEGERKESSLFLPRAIKRAAKDLPLPFLQEALARMPAGSEVIIEVPAAAQPGDGAEPVVWIVTSLATAMPDLDTVEWEKTDSGLEYCVLEAGEGEKVAQGDLVSCHYTGWNTDGVLFDSSIGSGPATFPLKNPGLIAGWVEGVPLIQAGGSILLRIPSELAYGEAGRPPAIPSNAVLVFQIDLLEKKG